MVFKTCDLEELTLHRENSSFKLDFKCELECLQLCFKEPKDLKDLEKIRLFINGEKIELENRLELKENAVFILLNEEFPCESLRLECAFEFELKAFKRKFPALLIAGRSDALGSRMSAFISAIYFSQKLGFKFGFVWQERFKHEGVVVESAQSLFEEDFLKEHDYSGVLPLRGDTNTLCFKSLSELKQKPFFKPWGSFVMNYYIVNSTHLSDLDEAEYKKEFQNIFYSLPFKEPFKEARAKGLSEALKLKDFVAIHMRGGDSIETTHYRNFIFSPIIYKYIFPVDLAIFSALHFMQKGFKVVLFSADKEAAFAMREYLKDEALEGRFFIASELSGGLSNMQAQIFEVTLMSRACKIIANHSTYSKFAVHLGEGELLNFNTYFKPEELFKAFLVPNLKDTLKISSIQKTASCAYAYILALKINASFEEKMKLLHLGLEFDTNNSAFRVLILDELFKKGFVNRAEHYLKSILNERCENFLFSLLQKLWGTSVTFAQQFRHYLKNANSNHPAISFVAAKIAHFNKDLKRAKIFLNLALKKEPLNELFLEFARDLGMKINFKPKLPYENSAKTRIHNHLAYKLGSAMIRNSKSLLGYLKMPFILSSLAISHKEEKRNLGKVSLPPLEIYSDYKEALKEKNCFTYKLGLALMKAQKNWHGGGYLLFFFRDLPKLISEFKAKKAKVKKS